MRVSAIFAALAGALLVLNADAATVDNEATIDVEAAVTTDLFTIVIKDEGQPNGRKRRKPENLASIDFPGSFVFSLKIDRTEKQVILTTNGNSQTISEYYNVRTLNMTSPKTIVLAVDQRKPRASMTLYINCEHFGSLHTLETLREVYYDMSNPHLVLTHERKFNVQVNANTYWYETLRSLNCTVSDAVDLEQMPAMQPQPAVNEIGIRMPSIGRGDIPINHDCDDLFFVKTIQELVQMVKKLREDVESQRLEIYKLRQLLEQCDDFCRPGMRNQ